MSNQKAVYKVDVDCGRMGEIEGVFVGFKKDAELLYAEKAEIDLGEHLGKHSEVSFEFNEENVKLITDEDHVVDLILEHGLTSGVNPFDHLEDYEDSNDRSYDEYLLYFTQGISS